ETLLDEVVQALVGSIEILRPDLRVICGPRITGLVRTARIEWEHIGIKSGDDLDDIKPFSFPISGQFLEFVSPTQAVAQTHPPGITEPEERRAIKIFDVSFVRCHANWPMAKQRIVPHIRPDLDAALNPM